MVFFCVSFAHLLYFVFANSNPLGIFYLRNFNVNFLANALWLERCCSILFVLYEVPAEIYEICSCLTASKGLSIIHAKKVRAYRETILIIINLLQFV